MMVFLTEIPAVLSDKSVKVFEGPLIYANNIEEAEKKAEEEKIGCIETSAKGGYNVKALFRKLATRLPGLETATEEINSNNMIDIKLTPVQKDAVKPQDDGGCGC